MIVISQIPKTNSVFGKPDFVRHGLWAHLEARTQNPRHLDATQIQFEQFIYIYIIYKQLPRPCPIINYNKFQLDIEFQKLASSEGSAPHQFQFSCDTDFLQGNRKSNNSFTNNKKKNCDDSEIVTRILRTFRENHNALHIRSRFASPTRQKSRFQNSHGTRQQICFFST